jgi:hypothetical protein
MSVANGNHYIDGVWVSDAPNGQTESLNPATGLVLGLVPIGRLHGVEVLNDFLETKHIYYEAEDRYH